MKNQIDLNSYFLMMKDSVVLAFDIDKQIVVKVEDSNGIYPFPLRNTEVSISSLENWLRTRALPLDRANAKALRSAIGELPHETLGVVMRTKGLSLIDGYWIKQVKDNHLKWEDVNLFDNPFSTSLEQTAFTGRIDNITIQGYLCTPEYSGQGTYVKSWKREGNRTYLYKGNYSGNESQAEVMASRVLDILEFDHVPYTLEKHHGVLACKCPNMVTEDKFTVPAAEVEAYTLNKYGITAMDYTINNHPQRWWEMMFIDGLIHNNDRHMLNWGYYMDSTNGELLEPHPLFDHNCSFKSGDSLSKYYEGKTLLEVAMYVKNRIDNIEEKLDNLEMWLNKGSTKKEFKDIFGSNKQYELIVNNLNKIRK